MKLRIRKHRILPRQPSLSLDVHAKRTSLSYTQEQMAEYLELSIGEYKMIESRAHIPKTAYFLFICRKLRLNPFCYLRQALEQEERDISVLEEDTENV